MGRPTPLQTGRRSVANRLVSDVVGKEGPTEARSEKDGELIRTRTEETLLVKSVPTERGKFRPKGTKGQRECPREEGRDARKRTDLEPRPSHLLFLLLV